MKSPKFVFTCESNLLAANGAPVLFLLILAGVLVIRVRVRGACAGTTRARATLLLQFLKLKYQPLEKTLKKTTFKKSVNPIKMPCNFLKTSFL